MLKTNIRYLRVCEIVSYAPTDALKGECHYFYGIRVDRPPFLEKIDYSIQFQ